MTYKILGTKMPAKGLFESYRPLDGRGYIGGVRVTRTYYDDWCDESYTDKELISCTFFNDNTCCGAIRIGQWHHYGLNNKLLRDAYAKFVCDVLLRFCENRYGQKTKGFAHTIISEEQDITNLRKILRKAKFKRLQSFVNPKTEHTCELWGVDLNDWEHPCLSEEEIEKLKKEREEREKTLLETRKRYYVRPTDLQFFST